MTRDHAIALSLVSNLPRTGLTARLRADPELLELASGCLDLARDAMAGAAAKGIAVTAWNDDAFPKALHLTSDCAPALWHRGPLDALHDAPCVAIVGSRAATAVALETAGRIAADLAAAGVTIVSGLARGVDSAAHRGALECGRTVAVLGSGVDCIYPSEHRRLANDIAAAGAVISEFPPGTLPLPYHFPMRNRLISGLSRAVVVIEAAEDSGSLITAACALEQGREVMAVPGNVLSGRNRGGHALIRDGAAIVESAADVMAVLGLDPISVKPADESAEESGQLAAVAGHMRPGEAYDIDALARLTGLDAARLLPRLADLELMGRVERVAGGRFVRPRRPC